MQHFMSISDKNLIQVSANFTDQDELFDTSAAPLPGEILYKALFAYDSYCQ